MKKKYKVLIIILIVISLLSLFYVFCVRVKHISDGYVGVKSDIGGFVNDSSSYNVHIVKGYVIYLPLFTEVYEYPIAINNVDYETFEVLTKDGVKFKITPSLAYQVNDKKVDVLYRDYRKPLGVINTLDLKNIVHKTYLETTATFASDSLIGNRLQLDAHVNNLLIIQLDRMGLKFKHIATTIDLPESLKELVDMRAHSIQNALVMEKQLVEVDFMRKIDSLRYSALTNLSIQKMFIDKWDGRLSPSDTERPSIIKDIQKDIQKTE